MDGWLIHAMTIHSIVLSTKHLNTAKVWFKLYMQPSGLDGDGG